MKDVLDVGPSFSILMLKFEQTRKGLREFIQFLKGKGPGHLIYTVLDDPITEEGDGQYISQGIDFENYKKKVNRYVEENKNNNLRSCSLCA